MDKQLGPIWEAQVGPIWGKYGTQFGPIWAIPFETQMGGHELGRSCGPHMGPTWGLVSSGLSHLGPRQARSGEFMWAPFGVNMGAVWPDMAIPLMTQSDTVISPPF